MRLQKRLKRRDPVMANPGWYHQQGEEPRKAELFVEAERSQGCLILFLQTGQQSAGEN